MKRNAISATALLLIGVFIGMPSAPAQEVVPVNAKFGIQWTPVDWSTPVRVTASEGAAGLPNGRVIGIVSQDRLDTLAGNVTSDYVILFFSYEDTVTAEYDHIPAAYDLSTNTASFSGPMTVTGGTGKFLAATGQLTIKSQILFGPLVGTFDIKGTITTAR